MYRYSQRPVEENHMYRQTYTGKLFQSGVAQLQFTDPVGEDDLPYHK